MRILLMWRARDPREDPCPERVAARMQELFSPLFAEVPTVRTLQNRAMSLVFLELPVRGWRAPFFEEDESTWAVAVDYPIDAQVAMAARGRPIKDDARLPALCRALEAEPQGLLRTMAPPFSLVWSSRKRVEVFVQNDGLGQSQLFEFEDDRLWAVTNKIAAFKALGIAPEPDRDQWAVRATLGWFPLDLTGYRRIRFIPPATRLRLDSHGLTRTSHEVLADWVRPTGLSRSDCLELARRSLITYLQAVISLSERLSVGLSGGWDTRAVVATLRALGATFSARVRGRPDRPDVLVASELARVAGFELGVHSASGLPPEDSGACQRCIRLALLWQAGHMPSNKHKSFLSAKPHLDPAVVNVMGQHGEIGRGYYATRIHAVELREAQYEDRLVDHLIRAMPPATRPDLRGSIREVIRHAYRQADRYDLVGPARLDFFYLFERTRRWASGSLNSQPGLVAAPFLNPDFIRATFAYPGDGKDTNPFHRHIIARHSPDWLEVPFARDLATPERGCEGVDPIGREAGSAPRWKQAAGNRNYDSSLYWSTSGRPLIDAALARGGFWTEIFDPCLAKTQWHAAPDDLVILDALPSVMRG